MQTKTAIRILTAAAVAALLPAIDMSIAMADTPSALEDVVVTARRREEALQVTPISVTAPRPFNSR